MANPPKKIRPADVPPGKSMSVSGDIRYRDPETPAERKSRLGHEEADANHQRRKESILLGLVIAISTGCLVIALTPWFDLESKGRAHIILAAIVSGAGTYLFTRPTPAKL